MEFVTIHDLSRELNVPSRVIRYRFLQLLTEGKLKEHEDFRRDDFKDELHFVWKIHPLRFMHETGLKPTSSVQTRPAGTNPVVMVNNAGYQPPSVATNAGNNPPPLVTETPKTVPKPDTKPEEPSLAREMIDLLKDQIGVKDAQLREQGEQLKETHELNLKLAGTMLQQAQEIRNLLRLTGGKTEMSEVVTKESPVANSTGNQNSSVDTNTVDPSTGEGEMPQAA